MLILTRRTNEALLIGSDISITVVGIRGNQVRLAINAPPNVSIDREEVRMRKGLEAAVAEIQPAKPVESGSRKRL